MFTLRLDVHVTFTPPMRDESPGVTLTRDVELPFPPHDGLIVHSSSFAGYAEPEGFTLREVIWDMDRSVFLADIAFGYIDEPMGEIVELLCQWIDRGWRLGSYRDSYREVARASDDRDPTPEEQAAEDRLQQMHTVPRSQRSKEFNAIFRAIIRLMAERFDQPDVAYAMDKTGTFFWQPPSHERPPEDKRHQRFLQVKREFTKLSGEELLEWRNSVLRHRSIAWLINAQMRSGTRGSPRTR